MNARGKEVTDNNGVQRIEVDDLVTKIRIGDGNIKLTAPPSHTLSGKDRILLENLHYMIALIVARVNDFKQKTFINPFLPSQSNLIHIYNLYIYNL